MYMILIYKRVKEKSKPQAQISESISHSKTEYFAFLFWCNQICFGEIKQ